jgi:hypothetical protein
MTADAARELTIFLLLLGAIGGIRAPSHSGYGALEVQTENSEASRQKIAADRQEQKELHAKCILAAANAERDAAAMIPGRTWTWRLDFERSRQQLGQLRRDFAALRDRESEFEAMEEPARPSRQNAWLKSLS